MGTVKGDSYRCYDPSHIGCRARPANFELRAELLDRKGDLALAEHQVLFFRDQPLDVESHKALGRYFGELPRALKDLADIHHFAHTATSG